MVEHVIVIGNSIGLQSANMFSVLSWAGNKSKPVVNDNAQEKIDDQAITTVGSKDC